MADVAVVVEEAAAAAGNPHFSKIRYLSGAPRSLGVAGTYNHMLSPLPFSPFPIFAHEF